MPEVASNKICYPSKSGIKAVDRLRALPNGSKVIVLFYHGLGDLIMFLEPYRALKGLFPGMEFSLGLPLGLKYEQIVPDAVLLEGRQFNEGAVELPYDLVIILDFPMNEMQTELTKGEWCCRHELGIEPVSGHARLPLIQTRLVAVHFNITCLPDSANPDEATAERVWNNVLEAGYIPLECHFLHVFANPVNKKFPFVDATVRRCRADVASLAGLLQHSAAFVGVVSGPFHVALSVLPPERILLLEKDFKRGSFTKLPIKTADLRDYKSEVKTFLEGLNG